MIFIKFYPNLRQHGATGLIIIKEITMSDIEAKVKDAVAEQLGLSVDEIKNEA